MKKRMTKQHNSGFTMVETLAVVAILVILLALSAVAVAYYRDYLKITELDNAAREIYMAAENRAVLLKGGSQLDPILDTAHRASTLSAEGGSGSSSLRYVTKEQAKAKGLLTTGAIDSALLEGDQGDFVIVYEPLSGSVTDVFYTEEVGGIDDIDAAYAIAGDRNARMHREGGMLGYYGGQNAGSLDYTPLGAAQVMVEIHNEERLTVDVTFKLPKDLTGLTVKKTVTLEYPGEPPIKLFDVSGPRFSDRLMSQKTQPDGSVTYTWVLDTLDTEEKRGQHFWQLFKSDDKPDAKYGGDFTVTAEIELSGEEHKSSTGSDTDTGNSLFAEGSGEDTARIENLRHLQNLDAETSGVKGKTAAMQLADIECRDNETYQGYEFIPIVNGELSSFNVGWYTETTGEGADKKTESRRYEIRDLQVTADSAKDKPGVGLFATSKSGTEGAPVTFTGVRLTDARVEGPSDKPAGGVVGAAGAYNSFDSVSVIDTAVKGKTAGGLVGTAGSGNTGTSSGDVYFQNCRVYWELGDQGDLRDVLGSDEGKYQYQIVGDSAGGLVGEAKDWPTIRNSFAATLVDGTVAGGLIGTAENPVAADTSYADCYLRGSAAAGGLIGQGKRNNKVTLTNAYSAGFIDTDGYAGGILGCISQNGTISAPTAAELNACKNVYSAMSYTKLPADTSKFTPGIPGGTRCYFMKDGLPPKYVSGDTAKTYEQMTSTNFIDSLKGTDEEGKFERKVHTGPTVSKNTYPYNLREKQSLKAYNFPGLKGLPHYGDWRAYFRGSNLVYYEKYNDGTVGFAGGNARYLVGKVGDLESDTHIESDGYAVAMLEKDLKDIASFTVEYTYIGGEGKKECKEQTQTYIKSGTSWSGLLTATWAKDGEPEPDTYYLVPLPEDLVNAEYASEDFYQYLHIQVTRTAVGTGDPSSMPVDPESEYFYNPHFAETVEPYKGDTSFSGSNNRLDVDMIREYIKDNMLPDEALAVSVRTPRHLYDLSKFKEYYHSAHSLAFQQGLDLDYKQYTGYGFPGIFEGTDKWPRQAPIGRAGSATSFKGSYDGGCHFIKHVPLALKDEPYAGLFGYSIATLKNIVFIMDPDCGAEGAEGDVKLRVDDRIDYCLGALAGYSTGAIVNCAVEGVHFDLSVSGSKGCIGGLVGKDRGSIQGCAAEVASLSITTYNYCDLYVGGLVGQKDSSLDISASYAVGRITADAERGNGKVSLAGFVGSNAGSGAIHDSYSAMDLEGDGEGAESYGFCGGSYQGKQENTYYLDNGNFGYRGKSFLADYEKAEGGAEPVSYTQLTGKPEKGEKKIELNGMTYHGEIGGVRVSTKWDGGAAQEDGKDVNFPYYTGVTDDEGFVHYGQWPKPMDLGDLGMYYWEELKKGSETTYRFSVLAVYPDLRKIVKDSTLSINHDEGGEVVRYGYGTYSIDYAETDPRRRTVEPVFDENNVRPLLYWNTLKGLDFANSFVDLEAQKETADGSSVLGKDRAVDEKLAELNPGYEFHSFHTYDLDDRTGLYPKAGRQDCTLTLSQKEHKENKENERVRVSFTLSPLFADAMSVKAPEAGKGEEPWQLESKVGKKIVDFDTNAGQTPGSVENPYEVRSVSQLKMINWYNDPTGANEHDRTTTNIMTGENIYTAPAGGGQGSGEQGKTGNGFYAYDMNNSVTPHVLVEYWVDDKMLVGYSKYKVKTYGGVKEKWDVQEDRWMNDPNRYIRYKLNYADGKYTLTPTMYDRVTGRPVDTPTPGTPSSDGGNGGAHFPYLNSKDQTTQYHWEQTYDLNGSGKDFTPIAEYYDTSTGDFGELKGWFGGTYDGGSYKIEDLDIRGQVSSCAGLFGVVYNGQLRNIVLHKGAVSTGSTSTSETQSQWIAMGALAGVAGTENKVSNAITNCSVSGYTINVDVRTPWTDRPMGGAIVGGLVGASHMDLSGCSAVADVRLNAMEVYDNVRVGGLAGICQGRVTQCYAGGEIELSEKNAANIKVNNDKGIYVGGLVGGSYMHPLQVDIDSQGGKITYIGQVNQTWAEKWENNTGNVLTNCYSYVKLPCVTAHSKLYGLYAVGGTGEINPKELYWKDGYEKYYDDAPIEGAPDQRPTPEAANHGVCTMTNCFYLANEVLANNQNVKTWFGTYSGRDGVTYGLLSKGKANKTDVNDTLANNDPDLYPIATPVTYEQLAGKALIDAPVRDADGKLHHKYIKTPYTGQLIRWVEADTKPQSIYTLLNAADAEGKPVSGRFDHVTVKLDNGLPVPGRYSYPTGDSRLTDMDYPFPAILKKEGNYVHYGDWPLGGFFRRSLDSKYLGMEPITVDRFVDEGVHEEELVLAEGTTLGGSWTLKFKDEEKGGTPIENTNVKAEIRIDGNKTILKVTGKERSDIPPTIIISYTVGDAEYSLRVPVHVTEQVRLRPSKVYMFPDDKVTVKLTPHNTEGVPLDGELTLLGDPASNSSTTLTAAKAEVTAEGGKTAPGVTLTTTNAPIDTATATVNFKYNDKTEEEGDGTTPLEPEPEQQDDIIQVQVFEPWKIDTVWETKETPEGEEAGSKQVRAVCTITFPKYEVTEGETLTFDVTKSEILNAEELKKAEIKWEYALKPNGSNDPNILKLTYPWEEVKAKGEEPADPAPEGLPDVRLRLTLTMDSTGKNLIPEAQEHTLTLTVKPEQQKPDDTGNGETGMNVTETSEVIAGEAETSAIADALPPAADEKLQTRRKRRQRA